MAVYHSSKKLQADLNEQEPFCSVFFEIISRKDISAVTPCKHKIHHRCIEEALQNTNCCSVCKQDCASRQLSLSNNNLAEEMSEASDLAVATASGVHPNQIMNPPANQIFQ